MIQRKKKLCNECKTEQYIWAKGMCKSCVNLVRKSDGKKLGFIYENSKRNVQRVSKINNKRKPTGEAILFKAIWNTRPHICVNCKISLGNEAKTFYFSHIVKKSFNKNLRLCDRNIVLECENCHYIWDFGTIEQKIKQPSFEYKLNLIKELDILFWNLLKNKVDLHK